MVDDFFPTDYVVPDSVSSYMKFKAGDNTFRVLSSPIMGYEYWVDGQGGKRTPIRKRMTEALVPDEIPDPESIKHFWAMVVYNYEAKKIQILEITQKSIQRILRGLAKNPKWGSPKDYDLIVNKTGEKLETEYTVTPDPKTPLDSAIEKQYKGMSINLEALFDGEDPFKTK